MTDFGLAVLKKNIQSLGLLEYEKIIKCVTNSIKLKVQNRLFYICIQEDNK